MASSVDLPRSIGRLCRRFERRTGLLVGFVVEGAVAPLAATEAAALIRTGHAILVDVARAARASVVAVRLSYREAEVRLSVRDDGVALLYRDVFGCQGYGLRAVQRDFEAECRELHIRDGRPGGTCVDAVVRRGMHRMGRLRVVVVDDHDIIRRGVIAMIDHESDMEVVGAAATGEEAVELVDDVIPDVVIVDDSLPSMSGVELCGVLADRHPETAVLALSGHPEDMLARRFVEAGAKGYLAKDVDGFRLSQAVRAVAKGEAALDPKLTARLLCWADRHTARAASGNLTPRELEVLRLVARGATNKVVARELHLSENTVKTYVQRALDKLECHSRTEAAGVAARRGLL